MSLRGLAMVTMVVHDYDDAIAFFVEKLDFHLVEDRPETSTKRWVVVESEGGMRLLLAKAANAEQAQAIGHQAGGRVGFFLYTPDFAEAHARMTQRGVQFSESPRHEPYGIVAVFEDLYGNRWDLIESAGRTEE
jgi:catechol 2,3-dioxygenase-like lactoylglutathione lyase family enzyme